MKTFLWTLAIVYGINTVVVLWCAVTGTLENMTPASRALDAIVTFLIGVWAVYLLATLP